jgi:O-succinylbenzoic acid--CoA ligase
MRALTVVDVSNPLELVEPLRQALFEEGPAVLPRPGGAKVTATAPLEVPDSVAVVIETSGTTGAPKRVALGAHALLASAEAAHQALGEPGQWLLALPAHYIAGVQVLTRSLLAGTTPIVLHPQPFSSVAMADRADDLREAAAGKPMYTSLVPLQLQRILDDASSMPVLDELMTGFARILVGGQAIPASLIERARAAGYSITRTYGSSETAGGCVWDQGPIGDAVVNVVEGRLALSGSMLAEGYLEDDARTEKSFVIHDHTRWYLSDDAGYVDAEGLVHVHGRVDDVIVSGGVKVSLAAVEKVIHHEYGAVDALVVAKADTQWGQVPVVVSSTPLDLVRVRLVVQKALGVEARPERIVQMAQVPQLPSGKPDRLAATRWVEQQL